MIECCGRAGGDYMLERAESDGSRAWRCWLIRHCSSGADAVLALLLPTALVAEALSNSSCLSTSRRLQRAVLRGGGGGEGGGYKMR
jgi:hypothetical protein